MTEKINNVDFRAQYPRSMTSNMDQPSFCAKLTPYRSLGRNGFLLLMAFVSFTCLVSGIFFLIAGAWPVLIAMGIDVLAIWLAFKLSYRSACAYEEVLVWPHEMIIRKVLPSGRQKQFSFNPLWVNFKIDRHEDFGVTGMRLREAGRELELGKFLNPDDRSSFASAFRAALADIRR